jgi:uncharacterized damage-inducible protein DinB
MNKEIQYLSTTLSSVLDGTPWYGRPVYELLAEVDPGKAGFKPAKSGHSMLELVYHMITWSEFSRQRLEGIKTDMAEFEKLDWREIDPAEHTWESGLKLLKDTHEKVIALLEKKDDAFLAEKVDYRNYNFRFMLNGLVQHNIYHLGQIAYINKLLV